MAEAGNYGSQSKNITLPKSINTLLLSNLTLNPNLNIKKIASAATYD